MFQTNLGTLSAEETADRKKILLTKAMKNILRKNRSISIEAFMLQLRAPINK